MTSSHSPATTATLGASASGIAALVRQFRLTVTAGPDAGTRFPSKGDRLVIGTHESAELRVTDDTVSRFHCELVLDGARVVVRDLGSRNGTTLDGVEVREALIRDGATIGVGRTQLRFEQNCGEVSLPISEHERFGPMVGKSLVMRRVFSLLEHAAASDAAVLLEGETGTGKEIAAESIHAASARKDGPFVVIDCSAIPPDLLEAELFGYERGAFTGATTARDGAFEIASGGTVFLDEIGELAPNLQPKLLRVLEKRQIKRIGNPEWRAIDVRVIAATNRSLRHEVNEKRFRSDLFYRLAVVVVRMPALREHAEDLPLIVDALLTSLGASGPESATMRDAATLAELARHGFPGNVRELRNYIERCLALRTRVPIAAGAPEANGEPDLELPLKIAREKWTQRFERLYLEEALRRSEDNVSAAARAAGIDRMHFYRLLWRHGLR